MGTGGLCPAGVPSPREHPPPARETRLLWPPRVRAAGAHGWVSRAVGTQWVIAPQAGTAGAGRGCQSPCGPYSRWHAVLQRGPCPAGAAQEPGFPGVIRILLAMLSDVMDPPSDMSCWHCRQNSPALVPSLLAVPCSPAGIFHLPNKVWVDARCQAVRCSPFQDQIPHCGAPALGEGWQGAGVSPGLPACQGREGIREPCRPTHVSPSWRGGRHLCRPGHSVRDQT